MGVYKSCLQWTLTSALSMGAAIYTFDRMEDYSHKGSKYRLEALAADEIYRDSQGWRTLTADPKTNEVIERIYPDGYGNSLRKAPPQELLRMLANSNPRLGQTKVYKDLDQGQPGKVLILHYDSRFDSLCYTEIHIPKDYTIQAGFERIRKSAPFEKEETRPMQQIR